MPENFIFLLNEKKDDLERKFSTKYLINRTLKWKKKLFKKKTYQKKFAY